MIRKISIGILGAFLVFCAVFMWQRSSQGPEVDGLALIRKPPATLSSIVSSSSFPLRTFSVPIFIYHSIMPHPTGTVRNSEEYRVLPQDFDAQLAYLKQNGYTVISFESLIDAMISTSTVAPPSKSVVITFDDGWENQYENAFPILKKYGDTATFFVFTNGMGSKGFMTWAQLREMQDAGMDIESHSVSHPYLFAIANLTDLWKEIEGSKELITAHLGKSPDLFAYPFGLFNDLDVAMLKTAGYRAARADLGWPLAMNVSSTATSTDALYKLNGIQVTDDFRRFLDALPK